jgi:hypothetical protein
VKREFCERRELENSVWQDTLGSVEPHLMGPRRGEGWLGDEATDVENGFAVYTSNVRLTPGHVKNPNQSSRKCTEVLPRRLIKHGFQVVLRQRKSCSALLVVREMLTKPL